LLKQKKIEFKAVIAGDGVECNNIKGLIKELHLENDITMLGWITDKAAFYNDIDIFCIPSIEESFGIVILEAFMYSTPVIVSDLPGPLEIVQPNVDALIFEVGNIIELAEQIEFLINNHEVAQILAKNAFDKVKSYDINFISNRLVDLVLKLS
jgi:glycosyltransferase involved in cell wall biosynthesis